jgi:hypothetical protein
MRILRENQNELTSISGGKFSILIVSKILDIFCSVRSFFCMFSIGWKLVMWAELQSLRFLLYYRIFVSCFEIFIIEKLDGMGNVHSHICLELELGWFINEWVAIHPNTNENKTKIHIMTWWHHTSQKFSVLKSFMEIKKEKYVNPTHNSHRTPSHMWIIKYRFL